MMGWRTKLVGGAEYDALTRWKKWLRWRPGVRKSIKRQHNKRVRREAQLRAERRAAATNPTERS